MRDSRFFFFFCLIIFYKEHAILSSSFLENGFCLSPLFDNTHLSCAIFDAICGGSCLVAMLFTKKSSLLGVAAYFFAHSYGHYDAGVTLTGEQMNIERMGIKDMIVMAAILSIGPFGAASNLIKSGKVHKTVANTCALLGLCLGVAVFATFLRRPCYALLYINVFIILTESLTRAIAIGYTSEQDVKIRASKFHSLSMASGSAVLAIVFCEPFYCDSAVKYIGGHAVFDFALAVNMFVEVGYNIDEVDGTKKIN